MQNQPVYTDVVDEIEHFFEQTLTRLVTHGLPEDHIVLDVGIGFGKTLAHNLSLLAAIPRFLALGRPLLAGLSLKQLFGDLLGLPVTDRRTATQVATALLRERGVFWHRVHHVRETRETLLLARALKAF